MNLHEALAGRHGRGKKKRFGRGDASGHGGTSGRGHKGAGSRSGYHRKIGYEGGQTPLIRRVPKVGFNNPFGTEYAAVNVGRLEGFEEGASVTPELLKERGIIKSIGDGVKILGDGELTKKLTVSAHKFSKTAVEKIKKAGGEAKEIS
jgi:large subunit ribosomal protein L15